MTPTAHDPGTSSPDTSPAWQLRPSEYLATLDLGEGEYIVWNRFSPVPTLLNETALEILHGAIEGFSREELEQCRALFLERKLAYEGESDPSQARFVANIDEYTHNLREKDESSKTFYSNLQLTNDPCNVGCTYCMIPAFNNGAKELVKLGKKPPPPRAGLSREEKLERIKKVLDQYIQTHLDAGAPEMIIGMGGGEILAQWSVVKGVIEYATERYPEARIRWSMNSSLTILTEEQAAFLAKHGVDIHTSIDGYKENHDKYRAYHNGKGTFDDVLEGIERYNEHSPEHAITAFQGTIAKADEFDANEMFEFVTSKFEGARMAPNLLGVSVEEGEKQADLMMDLKIAGEKLGFNFGDTIFEHMNAAINARGNRRFSLYCIAMTNAKEHSHVAVNISTMQASRSCSFVPSANVSLDELDYDLFNKKLWDQNVEFAEERAETIKKNCMSCEIAGLCHGSCVLNGIDGNNQMNPAGCAYLRRLWRRLVAHLHNRGDRIPSQTRIPVVFDKQPASTPESAHATSTSASMEIASSAEAAS